MFLIIKKSKYAVYILSNAISLVWKTEKLNAVLQILGSVPVWYI